MEFMGSIMPRKLVTVKPRLLDLFSGAGGCAKGYQRAGFYVVGVDIEPQPNYCGNEFYQGDALDWLRWLLEEPFIADVNEHSERWIELGEFDAIHVSPPCQRWSTAQPLRGREHPDLLTPTREFLLTMGLPYVIENVPGAPLREPLVLCGSSFGLPMLRHRHFECNFPAMAPNCAHGQLRSFEHRGGIRRSVGVFGHEFPADVSRAAMGTPWMTRDECAQAIPPAMTEHVGHYLLAEVNRRARAAA